MKDHDFWSNFGKIPKSLIRVCMFITRNGNRVEKRFLANELVRNGIVSSASVNTVLHRGIEVQHILKEENGYISVVDPQPFIVKAVRGSFLDNWRALIFIPLALAIIFGFIIPEFSVFCAIVSFLMVVGWFIEDYINIKKF